MINDSGKGKSTNSTSKGTVGKVVTPKKSIENHNKEENHKVPFDARRPIKVDNSDQTSNIPNSDEDGGAEIVNLDTGFKRITGQNRVEWSKSLSDNAVSIRIRYTVNGVGVLVDEKVAKGSTFHIYDPGTSKAAGKYTKVELIVDYGDKTVNETGALELDKQLFVCSAN
jgi:hypothetical protein